MKLTRKPTLLLATVPALVVGTLAVGVVVVAPKGSASTPTLASLESPMVAPPSPPVQFRDQGSTLTLAVPAATDSPGYTVVVRTSPFQITTQRSGGTVLQTTAGVAGSSGPADFRTASGWATATAVQTSSWHDGVLDLVLATTVAGDIVAYRITPEPDRYRMTWSVQGPAAATQVASHYLVASSGHWYGQGEARTPDGGPHHRQPWPLDSAKVRDQGMGPASYLMVDPFWFTQRGSGLWVDTQDLMDVAMNDVQQGVFGYTLTTSRAMDSTVFVERAPRDVYRDYIGITGTPAKSDATAAQYAKPLWNSWGQFYENVTQASTLSWAKGLHDAGVPAQAIQVDDGWMSHYGDVTFNSKFPDPKLLSDQIHAMGFDFGLWETLWINKDADSYAFAVEHGYLVKSKTDPAKACDVTWWNGEAGIVDLANPEANAWYVGRLKDLEKTYGVDGFKFDTRFFDERCAPYPGHTVLDYLTLGAQMSDQFDHQGVGVRIHWTGSQKYGFVTRQIDKGTSWNSLQVAVAQNLAISTIGYPFVETDMIGGSFSGRPPTKEVLVRWAQAASLMPLMYSSASPLGVSSRAGTRSYDQQTVDLYAAAVKTHERLAPYINKQVSRAVSTGEPIMKPLFFNYPDDQATYAIDDQWLLGDSLLAAPILANQTSRDVHVPAGNWFDVANRRVVKGPADLTGYTADLTQTPTFIRLGTPDTDMLMLALDRATQPASATMPTLSATRAVVAGGDDLGHLDLGPADLPETRTVSTPQPGVTLTQIARGAADPSLAWTLEVLVAASGTSPDPDAPPSVLGDQASAGAVADRLRAKGFPARVEEVPQPWPADVPAGTLGYRVRVGSYPTKSAADTARALLAASGESGNSVYTGWDGERRARGPWQVKVVSIDPRTFRGSLAASYGPDLHNRETTSQLSRVSGATVGVNGGFFVLDPAAGAPGDPAGIGVYDGKLLSEPINGRPALFLHADARGTSIGRLSWKGSALVGGRETAVDGINRVPGLIRNCGGDSSDTPTALPLHDITCTDDSELVAFTSQYGSSTPSGTGREVVLDSRQVVRSVLATRGAALPPGSTSLQGIGAAAVALGQVHVGDRLEVRTRLVDSRGQAQATSGDTTVVNGGPLLVQDGREHITAQRDGMVHPADPSFAYGFVVKRNPRTFAGVDAQGRTVLVTVDGRSTDDLGLSIQEAADVARSLGLVDAINLDGGGSTTMALNGELISRPSDATGERPVGDALLVLPTTR